MTTIAAGSPAPSRALGGPTLRLMLLVLAALLVGVLSVRRPDLAAALLGLWLCWMLPWVGITGLVLIAGAAQSFGVSAGSSIVPIAVPIAVVVLVRGLTKADRCRLELQEITAIAFIGLLACSSLLEAGDRGAALRVCVLMGAGVAAFIGLSVGSSDVAVATRSVRLLLGVLAANAIIGIAAVAAHVVIGTSWGVTILERPEGFPSARGIAFEHNLFGSTCAIGAVLFLGLWRVTTPVLSRRDAVWGFWLCAGGLALSLTRGAWVGFAAGAVLVVMLTRRDVGRRHVGRLVFGGAVLLIGVLSLSLIAGRGGDALELLSDTAGSVGEQGARIFEFSRSTGYLRAAEWRTALDDASASPWFGLGANTYGERHTETTIRGPIPSYLGNWAVRTVHDAGVVGLALLAGFLAAMVWPGRRVRTAPGEQAAVIRIMCAAGITMVIAYLAADAFLLVWPWAVLGVFRAYRRSVSAPAAP